jgi:hypothetical protein
LDNEPLARLDDDSAGLDTNSLSLGPVSPAAVPFLFARPSQAQRGILRALDPAGIEALFAWEEGYSRPDWKGIGALITGAIEPEKHAAAWDEAVLQWVDQLRLDLGGQYSLRRSDQFVLLSELEPSQAGDILRFAENSLEKIDEWLKEAAAGRPRRRNVILLFTELEDYYQYISYYYREGVHPTSGGVLIHRDYVHIAIPYDDGRRIRKVIAHELVHNGVVGLALPTWVNEGLAVTFERGHGARWQILDHDLREKHLAFWNRDTIQAFWAGVSFRQPGDLNRLSYSLAEILLALLIETPANLSSFVTLAHWQDAGHTAALEVFGADLGQVAATFLGAGDWRPSRKTIAELVGVKARASPGRKEEHGQESSAVQGSPTRALSSGSVHFR